MSISVNKRNRVKLYNSQLTYSPFGGRVVQLKFYNSGKLRTEYQDHLEKHFARQYQIFQNEHLQSNEHLSR